MRSKTILYILILNCFQIFEKQFLIGIRLFWAHFKATFK